MEGLEPPSLSAPDPKSGASTISATSAIVLILKPKVVYLSKKTAEMELAVFSQTERAAVVREYRRLLRHAKPVLKNGDTQRIRTAFRLAVEAHQDMRRKSGEPYIFHPIAVADICVNEIGLGTTSVMGALLHDVVEDTKYTLDDIRQQFGDELGEIIDGLTKISGVFARDTSAQAENFRKVLLTLSKDARVILIKIADRLHNMRTLSSLTRSQQLRIASETVYLYAPLAHRLGLYSIKTELEDLYLKHAEPDTYHQIANKINETKTARDRFIRNFIKPLQAKVRDSGIEASFKGRPKSIHSIWNKMKRQGVPFEEVYDLFAVRITIDASVEQEKALCWRVYSIITDTYAPNPDRLKDWVSMPKANGYESLHTTVMSQRGRWVEVQIRSQRMDEIAEKGYAAHWKYKTKGKDSISSGLDQLIVRLREMLESKSDTDAIEFMKDFQSDLSREELYVFTPKGELKILPSGSSVLDFAFDIHTDVGKHCIGAKINHKLAAINCKLHNGDQVEVLTSRKQLPSAAWLKHVVSSKAISRIKQAIRHHRSLQVEEGKEILKAQCKKQRLSLDVRDLQRLAVHFGLKRVQDMYYEIGTGNLEKKKLRRLQAILQQIRPAPREKKSPLPIPSSSETKQDNLLIGENLDVVDYKMAPCCNPIPGDEVFGFVTGYDGIKVHRTTCKNAPELLAQHGDRIMRAEWASKLRAQALATLQLKGMDRIGIMQDIMYVISKQLKINTKSVEMRGDNGLFTGEIKVFVQDISQLQLLIDRAKKIAGIAYVARTDT